MSGTIGERLRVEMPSAVSRPDFTWGCTVMMLSKSIATSPACRSVIDCWMPLYGTCVSLTPAMLAKCSVARCTTLPTPLEA